MTDLLPSNKITFTETENHTFRLIDKSINNQEQLIDGLRDTSRNLIQLTTVVTAAGMTSLGLAIRSGAKFTTETFQNDMIITLGLIGLGSLIIIILITVLKVFSPENIRVRSVAKWIENSFHSEISKEKYIGNYVLDAILIENEL